MKIRQFASIAVLFVLALSLSTCDRGRFNNQAGNITVAPTLPASLPAKFTQAEVTSTSVQPTAIATDTPQITVQTALPEVTATADLSNDLNNISQQLDQLVNDLNSTDTLQDFK